MYGIASSDDYDEKKTKAKADLHTMIEAEKIKMDPKRLAAAMKCKAEMMKALEGVHNSKGNSKPKQKRSMSY